MGTFRAAAAASHITQPALWQQVRGLQDELGVALFERVGRRVRVTTAGAQLLERAHAVLGAASRMSELAAAIRAGQGGIVSIATPAAPVQHVLAPVIGALERADPGVRVEFRDPAPGKTTLDALREGEVDLAVGPRDPAYEGVRLARIDVRVVFAGRHAWARRRRVHVRELRELSLLVSPPGSFSRGMLERACAGEGFTPVIRLESASPPMLVALARSGYGTAVLASDALAGVTQASVPRLVHDGPRRELEAWLQWRSRRELTPAVRHFIEGVRATAPRPSKRRA